MTPIKDTKTTLCGKTYHFKTICETHWKVVVAGKGYIVWKHSNGFLKFSWRREYDSKRVTVSQARSLKDVIEQICETAHG